MRCHHFDAGRCRSCRWMGTPYAAQVRDVAAMAADALPTVPPGCWEPVAVGPESGFRNKAKMVVAGTADAPTLGILDAEGRGVDLRDCGIHDPRIAAAMPALAEHVERAGLVPYDVPSRRGELKHLLVTVAPDGSLMVRWVLRSTEALPRLRKHQAALEAALPELAVASVNVQPRHAAVLEGEEEHPVGGAASLRVELSLTHGPLVLRARPGGFLQTNHHVATQLYDTAARWLASDPGTETQRDDADAVWDLFCGVGGFALAVAGARPSRRGAVLGVETSEAAVEAAREAAAETGARVRFTAGDAAAVATAGRDVPGTVVVNPPRRGVGPLTSWLGSAGIERILYSSCHLGSLATDLQALRGFRVTRARVFDMFPQTSHVETMVLLERQPA